eukprot:TRINITY_DN22415_c0_g1_i1.p3 TRINITY_DN22415_c0_g1~~TRINITY_DN22415_c0_g1_i1.p3  ORF type:complete len:118 (+),score=26.32 TRINITY_DN22415_c0_g1_i1:552-905(+)
MYHWPLNYHKMYSVSAWYYLISRLAIMVGSLWTWWDAKDEVWDLPIRYPTIVYGLWLFVPFANIILNATQATTVRSLFGIARNVRRRLQVEAVSPHRTALTYAFPKVDFDARATTHM